MSNGVGLSAKSLGLAMGVVGALLFVVLGVLAMYGFAAIPVVDMMGKLYLGFAPTWVGICFGALWGFVVWFIVGVLIAYFYNKF